MIDEWGKGAKYWDKAWNPMIGCHPVSEGCQHCYAARLAERFPELQDDAGGFSPHAPKYFKRPPRSGVVFVGNITDIFGEWNSPGEIIEWLGSLDHYEAINLILTKRAKCMMEILEKISTYESAFPVGKSFIDRYWWGITAENQERLEERAPQLMQTGAYQKWISLEPLLGPINIVPWLLTEHQKRGFDNQYIPPARDWQYRDRFDWVVVGAESGPQRRPCKLEWVETIVEQCRESGVPVFVKQLDINGKLVTDINKFPAHLQIRQVPWKK